LKVARPSCDCSSSLATRPGSRPYDGTVVRRPLPHVLRDDLTDDANRSVRFVLLDSETTGLNRAPTAS
jgi:hypothetical protein